MFGESVHAESSVEEPDKGHEPSLGCVAAHAVPAENQVEAKRHARDQSGEEHEDEGGEVVEGLEDGDLGGDFEGREFREGAGARGSATASHCDLWEDGIE